MRGLRHFFFRLLPACLSAAAAATLTMLVFLVLVGIPATVVLEAGVRLEDALVLIFWALVASVFAFGYALLFSLTYGLLAHSVLRLANRQSRVAYLVAGVLPLILFIPSLEGSALVEAAFFSIMFIAICCTAALAFRRVALRTPTARK